MPTEILMPQMGESIFEGTVTKWMKKPGDKVERDEPLFEISTDKVDAEIPSPSAGTLTAIMVKEGETVEINTVVAVLDGEDAAAATPAATPAPAPTPAPSPAPSPAPAPATKPSRANGGSATFDPSELRQLGIRTSPLVRKMAQESNVDLRALTGTGAGGRITKADVQSAVAGGVPASAPATPGRPAAVPAASTPMAIPAVPREKIYFGRYEVEPMSAMRKSIAQHMVMSKQISPHVYSIEEVDVSNIAGLRAKMKDEFLQKTDTRLTYMPFFLRAVVDALRAHPTVNSSVDGANVVYHREVNLGVAVSLDWGLIVPVIKNADELNFLGLARALNDLASRARNKKLKPEEVQHSTFSFTNPGVFGGLMGLPVINQPNVAILGMGAIKKRAVVIDDAIAIRSMVYLTMSYDHRVVDGATAHQFLGMLKETLENWKEPIL